jgi:hypothetical protein
MEMFWTLFVVFALTSPHSFADVYSHGEGGIQINVPNDWYVDEGDEILSLETPDSSVLILFWVPEGDTWEQALDGLGAELDQIMEDVRVENDGEEGELNGMSFFEIFGTGSVEGIDVEWSLTLLLAKKPVIALAFAESDGWEANQDAVFKLIGGIQKMR